MHEVNTRVLCFSNVMLDWRRRRKERRNKGGGGGEKVLKERGKEYRKGGRRVWKGRHIDTKTNRQAEKEKGSRESED